MDNRVIVAALTFLMFVQPALAQTITCSVQPSEIKLDFYQASSYNVEFHFWNDKGDTDAIYSVEPDSCLGLSLAEYEAQFTVPKGTTISNPVVKQFKFRADGKGNKTCYLNIFCTPAGMTSNGTIAIRRGVAVKVTMLQPVTTPSVSNPNPSSSQGSIYYPAATTTSSTSTTTTTLIGQSYQAPKTETTAEKTESSSEGKSSSSILPIIILVGAVCVGAILVWKAMEWI